MVGAYFIGGPRCQDAGDRLGCEIRIWRQLVSQTSTSSSAHPEGLSMLEKRTIEAEILKEVYETLKASHGEEVAKKTISESVRRSAIEQAKAFAAAAPGGPSLKAFQDVMPLWTKGGALEIETRNVVLDEGAVAGCLPGSYVKLSVADTGCGMPPEVRDRVFEPFFTTKEVGKGTGLGLSMVYGFVRQSGGYVAVESAPGAGTSVALYLPKATQEADAAVEATQVQTIPGGSERILVVDDNEDLLEVTSAMLTTFGYRVHCARNGAEAMQMLERGQEFELLFSDVVMPNGMNGVELAREARRLSKDIKVLLTSGYAGNVLERYRAVDEFPIIDKPFHLADLARCLRSILQDT